MYGSIEQKIIKTFDWTTDREAIQNTFLPVTCEPVSAPSLIGSMQSYGAFELSGGHPYYLSMLGYSPRQRLGPFAEPRTSQPRDGTDDAWENN